MRRPSRKPFIDHVNVFYTYEHWRPDTGLPFYVGKGKNRQAFWLERNQHHDNIVAKLVRKGMRVEIRIVEHGLTEQEAFQYEIMRIALYRSCGIKLTNMTDGGEGVSGLKIIRSPFTIEHCRKLGDSKRGKIRGPQTAKHRKNISDSNKGKPKLALRGQPKSTEHRKNIGKSRRAKEYRWINNGQKAKMLPKNEHLPDGWKFGALQPTGRLQSLD